MPYKRKSFVLMDCSPIWYDQTTEICADRYPQWEHAVRDSWGERGGGGPGARVVLLGRNQRKVCMPNDILEDNIFSSESGPSSDSWRFVQVSQNYNTTGTFLTMPEGRDHVRVSLVLLGRRRVPRQTFNLVLIIRVRPRQSRATSSVCSFWSYL